MPKYQIFCSTATAVKSITQAGLEIVLAYTAYSMPVIRKLPLNEIEALECETNFNLGVIHPGLTIVVEFVARRRETREVDEILLC